MGRVTKIDGGVAVDDRGSVRFVNDFVFSNVSRFYQVENHKRGTVRAWHGHKEEAKYVYVAKGSAKVAVVKMGDDNEVPQVHVMSDKNPQVLYVPENHYNGFQTLEEDTIVMFFSTKMLQDSLDDDFREDWNKWNIWGDNQR